MLAYITVLIATPCLLCLAAIFFILKSPISKYFSDEPDLRKVHQQVVPRIGGLGILFTFFVSQLVCFAKWPAQLQEFGPFCLPALIFAAGYILILGIIDDIKTLNFKIKFLFQFLLATILVTVFKIQFDHLFFLDQGFSLGPFGVVISIFWLVGVMNAFNIIDGVDGLAACVSIIGFITVAVLANAKSAYPLLGISLVMTGATIAFLYYNFSVKRKVFLGDTGSLFLGTVLGLLSIQITQLEKNDFSLFVPILIVGYPVFDITVAMIRRFKKRVSRESRIKRRFLNMFEADSEHLHHRLVQWGLSHLQTTFLLSIVAATMGSVAIIISRTSIPMRYAIIGYLVVALLLILNRLRYIGMRAWLFFPRVMYPKLRMVGVIEPDEVFFYSLKNFEQHRLEFLNIPMALSSQFNGQFSAIVIYTTIWDKFEENWKRALRVSEFHSCPVFLIADQFQLNQIPKNSKPDNIYFIPKPVRVPNLVEHLGRNILNKERFLGQADLSNIQIPSQILKAIDAEQTPSSSH